MKRCTLLWIGVIMLAMVLGSTAGQAQEKQKPKQAKGTLKIVIDPLPSALDTLYPPKAKQPIWLLSMHGMSTPFAAIVADLFDTGLPDARTDFERFKAKYIEVSKLVPEWTEQFPMGPVEELGKALATDDRGKVMAAMGKVDNVCHACHVSNMPRVQQRYHWGDFYAIRIMDPLSKEEVDWVRMMKYLDTNFSGISVSVERGNREAAQRQFQGFNARFQTVVKETCEPCHGTDNRKYYVDENMQALILQLGQTLSGSSVDPKVVEPLTQKIGMESCTRCHLVHVPAAYAKFSLAK